MRPAMMRGGGGGGGGGGGKRRWRKEEEKQEEDRRGVQVVTVWVGGCVWEEGAKGVVWCG